MVPPTKPFDPKKIVSFKEVPINSYWLAADGGSYGYVVVGKKSEENGDIICKAFDGKGWRNEPLRSIDWFKLQYRYYRVA